MFHFLARVIPSLLRMAFPVGVRLLVLIAVFHVLKFFIRQWRGLGKR